MTLTTADLPVILADLARLEPTRFTQVEVGPVLYYRYYLGGRLWTFNSDASSLALVQAAVQEAIVARAWDYSIWYDHGRVRGTVRVGAFPPLTREADLPATALAGAFRDALLAQQEPANG